MYVYLYMCACMCLNVHLCVCAVMTSCLPQVANLFILETYKGRKDKFALGEGQPSKAQKYILQVCLPSTLCTLHSASSHRSVVSSCTSPSLLPPSSLPPPSLLPPPPSPSLPQPRTQDVVTKQVWVQDIVSLLQSGQRGDGRSLAHNPSVLVTHSQPLCAC